MSTVQGPRSTPGQRSPKGILIAGLVFAFLVAGFVSGYASGSPDGLEKVAGDKGFLDSSRDHFSGGFFLADYAVRGIENERLAGGLAGLIGVLLTLVVGTLLFLAVTRLGRGRPNSAG